MNELSTFKFDLSSNYWILIIAAYLLYTKLNCDDKNMFEDFSLSKITDKITDDDNIWIIALIAVFFLTKKDMFF
ncbi:MAG: hypothetical protein ATN36_08655 [Epulopiscium sp. Nele67-Bin005]|nr:MAG: hypothetical protein ATN36_08655 [Epulopiscium sp. Nele67-Bin005]